MIEFQSVTKRFNGLTAVDDVSLTVERGTICALVGTSGSGKSTLLRLVNRLIEADSGRVLLDGVDIAGLAPVELRRRIGYVIQSIGLFPHWTVERNIATVPDLLGWDAARTRTRTGELLEMLGLDPAIHASRYPEELSGGQQQRVGVARALAAEPELLLMDEPFGAVDPPTRRSLQENLLAIQEQIGTTILLVTHDVEEAVRLGSTIAVMEKGRLLQFGPPADILANPANENVARFFGGPLLGLHLLQATRVSERADFSNGAPPEGEPLDAATTLELALARMIEDGTSRLPVVDEENGRRGVIDLADVVHR